MGGADEGVDAGWSLTLTRPLTVCVQWVSPVRTTLKGTIPARANGREAMLGKAAASASSMTVALRRPFWKDTRTESCRR